MKESFSLNHLDEVEFEEFCYDLLKELGFKNLTWRKGTGLSSSPSDRGRDIECTLHHTEIDGKTYYEKWFVECKHSIKGVSPDKIQNVLSWANAERPDRVLIIASNYLSNPTKDYINDYENNNHPSYKIKLWEKTELEQLSVGKTRLLNKYRIVGEFPFLSIMHPAHLLYIRRPPINKLTYLFMILDNLDVQRRDNIMNLIYAIVIGPKMRRPVTGKEKIKDLLINKIDYEIFKKECMNKSLPDFFLVNSIVNFTLSTIFHLGDITDIDTVKDNQISMIESLKEKKVTSNDPETYNDLIEMFEKKINLIERDTQENYDLYQYFCENVVKELFKEKLVINIDF